MYEAKVVHEVARTRPNHRTNNNNHMNNNNNNRIIQNDDVEMKDACLDIV